MQVSHPADHYSPLGAINDTQTHEGVLENLEKVSSRMRRYAIAEDIYLGRCSLPLKRQLSRALLYLHFYPGLFGEVEQMFHSQHWRPAFGHDLHFMGLLTNGPRRSASASYQDPETTVGNQCSTVRWRQLQSTI